MSISSGEWTLIEAVDVCADFMFRSPIRTLPRCGYVAVDGLQEGEPVGW